MTITSTPAGTSAASASRLGSMGQALMWIAAAGAAGAALSSIATVLGADGPTKIVETWRLYGLVVFAGLFALLALRPRAYRKHHRRGRRTVPPANRRLSVLPRLDRVAGQGQAPARRVHGNGLVTARGHIRH